MALMIGAAGMGLFAYASGSSNKPMVIGCRDAGAGRASRADT